MRQVYALLGLVKSGGDSRVEAGCASALDHEVVNVGLIGRMLERGTEATIVQPTLPGTVISGRFARDAEHFAVNHRRTGTEVREALVADATPSSLPADVDTEAVSQ